MSALEHPKRPVLLKWLDAHRGPSEWTHLDEDYKPPQALEMYSAGYIVAVTDKSVTIAGHVGVGDEYETAQFSGEMTIPRVAVLWIRRLKAEKKAKP